MSYRCDLCMDLVGDEGWHQYRDMDGKVLKFCDKCNAKLEKNNLENSKKKFDEETKQEPVKKKEVNKEVIPLKEEIIDEPSRPVEVPEETPKSEI